MMTVQSIQCHMEVECTGHMDHTTDMVGKVGTDMATSGGDMWQLVMQLMWQGYSWMLTWQVQVDQSESDTCHHCNGDMWHTYMAYI
jgi:hypothetical protein